MFLFLTDTCYDQRKGIPLLKVLTVACKRAVTGNWQKCDAPRTDQWLETVEEMHSTGKTD